MREKPPALVNPEESNIALNPFEFGILDGCFSTACLAHGDGDSFSWTAGGGDFRYSIHRVSRGIVEKDDGSAATCWEFSQTNKDGETDTAYINTPGLEILDTLGDPAKPKLINDIANAVIDIAWEMEELGSGLAGVFAEDRHGRPIYIPRFRKP